MTMPGMTVTPDFPELPRPAAPRSQESRPFTGFVTRLLEDQASLNQEIRRLASARASNQAKLT
jgi:hypothetical protein